MTASNAGHAARVRLNGRWTLLGVCVRFVIFLGFAVAIGSGAVRADSVTPRVVGGALALMLTVVAVLQVAMSAPQLRRRFLVVTREAITHEARDGWAIGWDEICEVSVERGYRPTGGLYRLPRSRIWQIALHVTPRDAVAFATAHPELAASMRVLDTKHPTAYGIVLADDPRVVGPLDMALRANSPTVGRLRTYYGVVGRGRLFLE